MVWLGSFAEARQGTACTGGVGRDTDGRDMVGQFRLGFVRLGLIQIDEVRQLRRCGELFGRVRCGLAVKVRRR